jgi:hypothetical protein
MIHDNGIMYDAFLWDWSKSAICDDVIFISSKLVMSLAIKFQRPIVE